MRPFIVQILLPEDKEMFAIVHASSEDEVDAIMQQHFGQQANNLWTSATGYKVHSPVITLR